MRRRSKTRVLGAGLWFGMVCWVHVVFVIGCTMYHSINIVRFTCLARPLPSCAQQRRDSQACGGHM